MPRTKRAAAPAQLGRRPLAQRHAAINNVWSTPRRLIFTIDDSEEAELGYRMLYWSVVLVNLWNVNIAVLSQTKFRQVERTFSSLPYIYNFLTEMIQLLFHKNYRNVAF